MASLNITPDGKVNEDHLNLTLSLETKFNEFMSNFSKFQNSTTEKLNLLSDKVLCVSNSSDVVMGSNDTPVNANDISETNKDKGSNVENSELFGQEIISSDSEYDFNFPKSFQRKLKKAEAKILKLMNETKKNNSEPSAKVIDTKSKDNVNSVKL